MSLDFDVFSDLLMQILLAYHFKCSDVYTSRSCLGILTCISQTYGTWTYRHFILIYATHVFKAESMLVQLENALLFPRPIHLVGFVLSLQSFQCLTPHCTIYRIAQSYRLKDSGDFPPLSSWMLMVIHCMTGNAVLTTKKKYRWMVCAHHSNGTLLLREIRHHVVNQPVLL